MLRIFFLDDESTVVGSGIADFGEADACILQELLQLELMLVRYLDNHTRVLGKQVLHDIVSCQVMEVDMHTTTGVGEAHLQECGNQTTC